MSPISGDGPAGEILPYPSPCYNLLYLANHLSLDSSIGFRRTYPMDSDFSVRLAHCNLEQLEPELCGTSETKGTLIPPSDYLQFLPFFSLLPPFHQLTFFLFCLCLALSWPRKSAPVLIYEFKKSAFVYPFFAPLVRLSIVRSSPIKARPSIGEQWLTLFWWSAVCPIYLYCGCVTTKPSREPQLLGLRYLCQIMASTKALRSLKWYHLTLFVWIAMFPQDAH